MIDNMQEWQPPWVATCLTAFLLMSCSRKEAPRETAAPSGG
jgi:hypothetical protein